MKDQIKLLYEQFDLYLKYQGPIVQNIVRLTSSLVAKTLNVLGSTISNSQVFLMNKCELLLQMQKLLTFFSANILAYMEYLMIKVLTIRKLATSLVLYNWAQFALVCLPLYLELTR